VVIGGRSGTARRENRISPPSKKRETNYFGEILRTPRRSPFGTQGRTPKQGAPWRWSGAAICASNKPTSEEKATETGTNGKGSLGINSRDRRENQATGSDLKVNTGRAFILTKLARRKEGPKL